MRHITGLDRFMFYLDRALVVLACMLFLWVQTVKGDFIPLLLAVCCMVGWVFCTRYLHGIFKKVEGDVDVETKAMEQVDA